MGGALVGECVWSVVGRGSARACACTLGEGAGGGCWARVGGWGALGGALALAPPPLCLCAPLPTPHPHPPPTHPPSVREIQDYVRDLKQQYPDLYCHAKQFGLTAEGMVFVSFEGRATAQTPLFKVWASAGVRAGATACVWGGAATQTPAPANPPPPPAPPCTHPGRGRLLLQRCWGQDHRGAGVPLKLAGG